VRTIGKANVYTLNSKHYIAEQLRFLFRAEEGAKQGLKQEIAEWEVKGPEAAPKEGTPEKPGKVEPRSKEEEW